MVKEKICKHLEGEVRSYDRVDHGWCPECEKEVIAIEIVINLLKEILRRQDPLAWMHIKETQSHNWR